MRNSAQPNGREIRLADGPERGRLRLWNRSGSLTERYVDLVRSAMGVPG